jgi:hypothetical protein
MSADNLADEVDTRRRSDGRIARTDTLRATSGGGVSEAAESGAADAPRGDGGGRAAAAAVSSAIAAGVAVAGAAAGTARGGGGGGAEGGAAAGFASCAGFGFRTARRGSAEVSSGGG